jgi:hypothetical protein
VPNAGATYGAAWFPRPWASTDTAQVVANPMTMIAALRLMGADSILRCFFRKGRVMRRLPTVLVVNATAAL